MCGSKWKGFGQSDSGDFEARQSGSSVCFVSGGPGCLLQESGLSDLLCKEASGARARERDSHEDQGEASSKVAGDCLDVDEEEGEI